MQITHTFKQNLLAKNLLRLFGWRVLFNGLPGTHGVIIVYPHTSNWDFIVGIFAKWAIALPMRFWAKEGLFTGLSRYTLGPLMRYWGAVRVDRSGKHGAVEQTVQEMRARPMAWLALSPEGTRKLQPHIRSGFYRLALQLNAPLGLAYFDFENRTVNLTEFIMLTGDETRDLATIAAYYQGIKGCKPELASPVVFAPKSGEKLPN
jgi:1-acyl-sn-glycerol-3-phosphate acyltransferase